MNDRPGTGRRAVQRHRLVLLIAVILFASFGNTALPIAHDKATPVGGAKDGAGQVVIIRLGDPITVSGAGASVEGSTVRITAGGTYLISGTLKDGQIIVETKDKKTVNLVLNGVDITCDSSAPIYVMRAETTVIVLADGSENHIADGNSDEIEAPDANEPDAAIFSKGNLTFEGNGALTVEGQFRNAITSKDELTIMGGNITVRSANDGIRGRDFIAVKDGNITVNAGADGMQSNNDQDPERGFISIEGGMINITAGKDGIQAATGVVIRGGTITVSSGGGSADASKSGNAENSQGNGDTSKRTAERGPSFSAKGIKAVKDIRIEGGTIVVDSADDALHSDDSITIEDGNIVLASGDDGIHSDATLTINGGDITIRRSFEAIESAVITINGGNIRLAASDDGVNVTGTDDRAALNGRPGRGNSSSSVDKHLKIEGGYLVIDATGDGLDINGWVKMTGGTVIINGPIVSLNGALDYDREFTMAGGTLVAVGSFGMAQAPDATSTQYSLALNLGSPQPAGTLLHIEAEDGTGLLTFAPLREYQSVVYSSSQLKKGATYNVYVGGSSTGSVRDGIYSGGSYTPGTRRARTTI